MDTGWSLILVDFWANGCWFSHSPAFIAMWMNTGLIIHLYWLLYKWIVVCSFIWADHCVWTLVWPFILGWLCEWTLLWLLIRIGYCVNGQWYDHSSGLITVQINSGLIITLADNCVKGHSKCVKLSLLEHPLHTKSVFMFELSSFEIFTVSFFQFLNIAYFWFWLSVIVLLIVSK